MLADYPLKLWPTFCIDNFAFQAEEEEEDEKGTGGGHWSVGQGVGMEFKLFICMHEKCVIRVSK